MLTDFVDWVTKSWGGLLVGFVLLIGIPAITYVWKWQPEDKAKRDRRLRTHFEDMRKRSLGIMQTLTERYGQLLLYESGSSMGVGISRKIEKFSDDFVAHFPSEAAEWNAYRLGVDKHIGECTVFRQKIEDALASHCLDIRPDGTIDKSPCIYEHILQYLSLWWEQGRNKVDVPTLNFTQFDARGGYIYVAGSRNEPIAYADNDIDKAKCEAAIKEIALSPDYQQQANKLLTSGHDLVKKVDTLKVQLQGKIQGIHDNWPGTTDYQFRRLKKQCPTCRKMIT